MRLIELNEVVSVFQQPVLGSIRSGPVVMGLTVDPGSPPNALLGVVRVIHERKGDVAVPGFTDWSSLFLAESSDGLDWRLGGRLEIKGIEKVVEEYYPPDAEFLGLEDPDVFVGDDGVRHLTFTIAYKLKNQQGFRMHLGHAFGRNLFELEAGPPLVGPDQRSDSGYKELLFGPRNREGVRIHLLEGIRRLPDRDQSAIVAAAQESDRYGWRVIRVALDPDQSEFEWCSGDVSPCRLLPRGLPTRNSDRLAIINGRPPERVEGDHKRFGHFRPGLAWFDPEEGGIVQVSPRPLFEDPEARSITFASEFLDVGSGKGFLYAHCDDQYIKAYLIDLAALERRLPHF